MNIDLVIAISAAAFVAGLFIGVLRGWNACDRKWFDAERRGEQIEGPVNEFGDTPAYRVRRVDMMPIDFVPASEKREKAKDVSGEWNFSTEKYGQQPLSAKCGKCGESERTGE